MRTLPASEAVASRPPPSPPVSAQGAAGAFGGDPTLAAALFAAWSGDPAVIVASPPGAGKTTLVVHLAEQLHRRAQLRVAIAAQTRAQALDVTNRAAAAGASVALLGSRESHRPLDLAPRASYLKGTVDLSH